MLALAATATLMMLQKYVQSMRTKVAAKQMMRRQRQPKLLPRPPRSKRRKRRRSEARAQAGAESARKAMARPAVAATRNLKVRQRMMRKLKMGR